MKNSFVKKSCFIAVNVAILSGCATSATNKSQDSSSLDITTRSELAADIEVDVNKPVSGKARHSVLFGFIDIDRPEFYADGVTYNGGPGFSLFDGSLVEEVKAAAAYKAVNNAKIDILVMPQYNLKVQSRFMGIYKEVSAVVTGYPGKIKRIRNVFLKRPGKAPKE